uniref:Uncharacterized protein n=1 Tax=Vespula pensylvanica TaxID=30213 RepID=A0A834P4M4_VESPE|nr:hypothetical protein H0235_007322 [Vespula pensylvanica]
MEMKLLNVEAISRYNRSLINSPTMFVARRRDIKISTPCWKRVQSRSYGAMGLLKMMLKERIMEMSRHTNVGFPYYRRLTIFLVNMAIRVNVSKLTPTEGTKHKKRIDESADGSGVLSADAGKVLREGGKKDRR